jgi:hypothetical protein
MTFAMGFILCIGAAFTGTTSVIVGDGSDDDGWLATGVVNPASAGSMAYDHDADLVTAGKLYQTGDTVDITFGGATSWTAGSAKAWIGVLSYNEALTAT